MANDDDFEESSGSATDTTTATYKYCQIAVPEYAFDVTSSSGTAPAFTTDESAEGERLTSGSSFIRLGSFPDINATTGIPSGFANSVTLAKLIGDPDSLEEIVDDDSAPSDDGLLTSNTYAEKENYILGFADDTRSRKSGDEACIAGQTVENTTAVRKQETGRLLSKGGWWDHSDGNRITTTVGDKIEVIQGNYKMVVLGRKDPAEGGVELSENCVLTDASGGKQVAHGAGTEAEVMSIAWAKTESGEWTCYQDNGKGNLTAKFHGKKKEIFTGSVLEERIGEDPSSPEETTGNDPAIVEKTWATTIKGYKGSVDKPIHSIYEETYAKAIDEVTFAAAINEVTMASEIVELKTAAMINETMVGIFSEIVAGVKFEISGAKFEFIWKKDVFAEEEDEAVAMDNKLAAMMNVIAAMDTRICADERKLVGAGQRLAGAVTALEGKHTKLAGEVTQISGNVLAIGGMHTGLHGETFLG